VGDVPKRKKCRRKNPAAVELARRRAKKLGKRRCQEIASLGGQAFKRKKKLERSAQAAKPAEPDPNKSGLR